jgi:hypothetical protein
MSFIDEPLQRGEYDQIDQSQSESIAHVSIPVSTGPKRSPSPTLQSDLPVRRRPALGQSRTSPYPYPQSQNTHPAPASKITRPRPGLNRTLSFCPSGSDETYASASRPASPVTSPPGPGRLSKPLTRLSSGEVMAPSMERSMSSLGIDGWHYSHSRSSTARVEMGKGETEDETMDGYPDEEAIQVCHFIKPPRPFGD